MPTLEAGSKLSNITRSVNVFVNAQIRVALGYTIYYMGQDRVGTLPKRWVEAELMVGEALDLIKNAPGGALSVWRECWLNLNCFEQLETGTGSTNLYSLTEMAEAVRGVFLPTTGIPVYDYATSGTPYAGALMVWEPSPARAIATAPDAGISQINVRVPLRYHEVFMLA